MKNTRPYGTLFVKIKQKRGLLIKKDQKVTKWQGWYARSRSFDSQIYFQVCDDYNGAGTYDFPEAVLTDKNGNTWVEILDPAKDIIATNDEQMLAPGVKYSWDIETKNFEVEKDAISIRPTGSNGLCIKDVHIDFQLIIEIVSKKSFVTR